MGDYIFGLVMGLFIGGAVVLGGLTAIEHTYADGYCKALHAEHIDNLCVKDDEVVHRF